MAALIIIVVIGAIGIIIYLNQPSTKFNKANNLIQQSRFNDAQEILIKLVSKHPYAVTKYSECFYLKAEEFKKQKKYSEAINCYSKVIEAKKIITHVSDKTSFNNVAEKAFYEISQIQFDAISFNISTEIIKAYKKNLEFINSSEFNRSKLIPELVEKHKYKIAEIYFKIGLQEEKAGNFITAKSSYANATLFLSNNIYIKSKARNEICKLKLNEIIDTSTIDIIEKSGTDIRLDFYYRYVLSLLKNGMFTEAESIIESKLDINNLEIKKLIEICRNEKIKLAIIEIENINNNINDIYNNSSSLENLVELYDTITEKSNKLSVIIPDVQNDLAELKPSLFNRILDTYNERKEYGKAINLISKYPEFYKSPILMKNIGNSCLNYLNDNNFTDKNYKILIALFITSAYSDNVMLYSLEETLWDDDYTFSLSDSIGSSYEINSKIPENVNYDEISEQNISIGEAQKYLLSQFEKLINEQSIEHNLLNEITKFYESEKKAIENIISIIPNEIIFATPYFAKKFKIANSIIDELEHDYTDYKNEESLEAGIPYLNDNRDLWINDYYEAKKTIETLIESITHKNVSKFSEALTDRRKKLIKKFDSLMESIEIKLVDVFNSLIKRYSDDESVLDLFKNAIDFSPTKEKLKYQYAGYAANLCISKINADKMKIYKGLQIMSNAYKMAPNDSRVCSNLIALIRMNILDILNQRSNNASNIYSILDEIKSNRSNSFKNNAGELIKTRNEILNQLPSDARIAITSGINLNSQGRELKKGLDYLGVLGGSSTVKDPLAALREQLGLNFDLPF